MAAIADAPYAVALAVLKDGPKDDGRPQGQDHQRVDQRRADRIGWRRSFRAGRAGARKASHAPLGATTAQTAALRTKQIDGMIVEANAAYRLEEDETGRVVVQFGDSSRPSIST